jgi:uncharacterized protein with PQ loop repeat
MYFNTNYFAICATWIAQILFFVATMPQIWLNFKKKSTNGFSDILIFAYLNGYFFYLIYIFGLNLPIAYKIIVPNIFLATLILFYQRFAYSKKRDKKVKKVKKIFAANLLILFILAVAFFKGPLFFGSVFGYVTSLVFSLCYLPQIYKIYKSKKTKGFSFALISLFTFGDIIELSAAIILDLPLPTLINNCRAIFIYVIFCTQFIIYSRYFKTLKSRYAFPFNIMPARPQISESFNSEFFLVKINNIKFIKKKIHDIY